MEKTAIASIKSQGDWILIQSPYEPELVTQLKECIPWQERKWERPNWQVKPAHLEVVRSIVFDVAKKKEWKVLDYTAETKEAVEAHKQEIRQHDLDQHVEAVLAVLAKLPSRTLRLVDWQEGHITFELATFLDNSELFKALAQASLESYRPINLFGGSKRQFSHTFLVAEDERILYGLCQYAGITPIDDKYGSRTNVEYLHVRDLILKKQFDDGVAHFTDVRDNLWVGIPYQDINWDISWSHESWQVTCIDTKVYRTFKYEDAVNKLINVKEHQYVNPGVGFVVAQSHPSSIARFVTQAHIEEWFKHWGNELVSSDQLVPSPFSKPHWYSFSWNHPADELLGHISFTRTGVPGMCALLGWDRTVVEMHRQRIKQLKEEAVQRVIDDMKARSAELAVPKLQDMTMKDLLKLGEQYKVNLKKSWGKEKMIEALRVQPAVTEDVIGLTKRLEGK